MIFDLLMILLSLSTFVLSQQFNFPMQVAEQNQIYLQEYTPSEFQAPYYTMVNENTFNLNLLQSVQQLYNQSQEYDDDIICVSNFLLESDLTSNYFWFLTNGMNLYTGILDSQGYISVSALNIDLSVQNCFNLNLINTIQGVLTCTNSNQIILIIVNSDTNEQQQFSGVKISQFNNIHTNIQILDQNNYNIKLTILNDTYANIYTYNLNGNELLLKNQYSIQGAFIQICSSLDLQYTFLLSNISILLINNNTNHTLITFNNQQPQQMSIYQELTNLYRLVVLSEQTIQFYYVHTSPDISIKIKNQKIIASQSKIILFNMNHQNIYLITNNYIAVLDIPNNILNQTIQLQLSNFLSLDIDISKALINENRQMAILFYNNKLNKQFIQTFIFTYPQILIFQEQAIQITGQTKYYLNISISSQISQIQPVNFILNLVSVNCTKNAVPIPKQVSYQTLYIEYPDIVTIPFTNYLLGPNLVHSVTSSNFNLVGVNTNSNTQQSFSFTQKRSYLSLCANQQSIQIYCCQYQNYSIGIYNLNGINYIINPNYQVNVIQCQCFVKYNFIQALIQFPQEIFIQTIEPYFILGNITNFQFNFSIISSALFQNTLFIITEDNILQAYKISANKTSLFNITDQSFQYLYTNELSYSNLLFIDNTTNLVIISYNGQNSYVYVNSIQLPLTNCTQIKYGILQQGIYMALTQNGNNFVYYYPKFNIYVNANQQIYFQAPLYSEIFYGPNILSAYTSNHFYLMTVPIVTRSCCFLIYFKGTGSAFTAPTYQIHTQINSVDNFNVILNFEANVEMLLVFYYQSAQQQLIFGSIAMNESFILFPYFYPPPIQSQTALVTYTASSFPYAQKIFQNVTINYNRQIITSKQIINQNYNLSINNTGNIIINPNNFFNGNINNYTLQCSNCTILDYQLPINPQGFILQIQFQAAYEYNNNLYIQNNTAIYLVQNDSLNQIQTIPGQNYACKSMFVDIVSGFFVSICYKGNLVYIFSQNQTTNVSISNQISTTAPYLKSYYNNGLLQLASKLAKSPYSIYYSAYYIWIANDQINIQSIYNSSMIFSQAWIEFLFLSQSLNFSSQPCQIFGISILYNSIPFSNPYFQIIKSCMSSQMSQIFGFPENNYTSNQNIYVNYQQWYVLQSLTQYSNLQLCATQYGQTKLINEDIIVVQFILPIIYEAYRYNVLFNSTNGNLLSFFQENIYYITDSKNNQEYQMFQVNDGPLVNIEGLNTTTINLYVYPQTQNIINNYDYIQSIGTIYYNDFNENNAFQDTGNFVLFIQKSTNNTIVYQVSDHITLNVNMTGIDYSDLVLTAYNDLGSCEQILNIHNIFYQTHDTNEEEEAQEEEEEAQEEEEEAQEEEEEVQEEEEEVQQEEEEAQEEDSNNEEDNDNEENNNNNDNEENNNNNHDEDEHVPHDEDENQNNNKTNKKKTIIIVSSTVSFIVFVLIFVGVVYFYKKKKNNNQEIIQEQQEQQQFLELQ